jgi:hypothetical protein
MIGGMMVAAQETGNLEVTSKYFFGITYLQFLGGRL